MKKVSILLLVLLALLTGCKSDESVSDAVIDEAIKSDTSSSDIVVIDTTKKDTENVKTVDTEEMTELDVVEEEVVKEPVEEVIDLEKMRLNPLTGTYMEKEYFLNRPMAVMMDNFKKARPQAGLSQADIAYEMLVEGNITRYMAIFYSSGPKCIGPTRSARPYYLDKALEFDPLYIHVGGSEAAKALIKKNEMADIDGLYSGAFYRKKHKPIPNNMYTSTTAIQKDAKRKKYRTNTEVKFLEFNEKDTDLANGSSVSSMRVPYHGNSYYSGFEYESDKKLFYRYVNSKPHIDENNDELIVAKNIIIQYAKKKVIDSVGRLDIDLIGEGKAKYLTNGKIIDVTWKKESTRETTRFYDKEGAEIKLNPGNTWFQVVPTNMNVTIRE